VATEESEIQILGIWYRVQGKMFAQHEVKVVQKEKRLTGIIHISSRYKGVAKTVLLFSALSLYLLLDLSFFFSFKKLFATLRALKEKKRQV
jgi:hypothetical protein